MNDVLPASKDAPKTFAERGVTVPFTTSELLWARVRQNSEVKELLVPGLAQTRGIFVYEWPTIGGRFSLSLHDRQLSREVLIGAAPTPDTVASMLLKVTGSGLAGGDAKAATIATAQQTDTLALHTRVAVIQRIVEALGGTNMGLSVDDLSGEDGALKGTVALAQLAAALGGTGQSLYARVDSLSTVLGALGAPGIAVEAPNRRLIDRMKLASKALNAWADATQGGEAAGEARVIARVAAETAQMAAGSLSTIDKELAAIQAVFTEWTEKFELIRSEVTRTIWFLDGWERFLKLWENAAGQSSAMQSKALVLMSYVIPLVPISEVQTQDRRTWDEINAELAKFIAAHQGGVDMKTMLELLGPEAKEPLSALTIAAKSPMQQRRGLSDEKLTQIVRILEPAMDRPDGAPARKMLEELRPQLVRLRPPRVRRACRVVCQTFEELLVDGETTGKVASRIPRSAIPPVWSLFRERLGDQALSDLGLDLANPEKAARLQKAFVSALQTDLDDAAAFTSKARSLIVRLGSEAHYHAMETMVGAVAIADLMTRLRVELPTPPIATFEDEVLDKMADILNEIRKRAPGQIQTALFILMSRMAEPWNISSLLEKLATTGRFRSSAGISGFVATAMLGQLEGQVDDVRKLAQTSPGDGETSKLGESAMALADSIVKCTQSVAGTSATLAVSGTQGQTQEVETLRKKVGELLDSSMGGGAAALVTAFTGAPAVRAEDGSVRPGARWRFDAPLDPAVLRNAELYARALRRTADNAGVLGSGTHIAETLQQTTDQFEKVASVVFNQIRTGNLDRTQREAARGHVAGIAYVIEILTNTDYAEKWLNKGFEATG
jgi:hypothetical protein